MALEKVPLYREPVEPEYLPDAEKGKETGLLEAWREKHLALKAAIKSGDAARAERLRKECEAFLAELGLHPESDDLVAELKEDLAEEAAELTKKLHEKRGS